MKTPFRFLTSLLAGISLGLLFAPKKGKDLRRELAGSKDKMGHFGKELLAAAQDASGELKKFLNEKEVQDLIKSGKAEMDSLIKLAKKKGAELSEEAKMELREMTSGLKRQVKSATKAPKKTVRRKVKVVKKRVQKEMK